MTETLRPERGTESTTVPVQPGDTLRYWSRHPWDALRRQPRPKLGGPRGLPVVGVWPEYSRRPHEFLLETSRRYGDLYRLPLPIGDMVYVNRPDLAEQVLTDEDGFEAFPDPVHTLGERYLALFPGMRKDEYRERRRAFLTALSRRSLARSANEIVNGIAGGIEGWEVEAGNGEFVNITPRIAQVTLPMVLSALFATKLEEHELRQLDRDLSNILSAATHGFLPWTAKPRHPLEVPTALRRSYRLLDDILQQRLDHPTAAGEHPDMLDVIIADTRASGAPLRRYEQVLELLVVLTGAYDTIVASVSWTLAFLSQNPEARERLEAELAEVLGGRVPTFDDVGALSWTKACFDEAQRLQGGPVHSRFAIRDVEVGGHLIPRGTLVGVGWYSMHMDSRWWPEPERFDPNRFADPQLARSRPKAAFLPFSIGVHQCPGMGLAYLQATLVLANVVQRYDLELPEGWTPQHDYRAATGIKGGLRARIHRKGALR